jgi:hypothetical protein
MKMSPRYVECKNRARSGRLEIALNFKVLGRFQMKLNPQNGKRISIYGKSNTTQAGSRGIRTPAVEMATFLLCSSWDDIDKVSTGTFVGHLQTVRAEIYNGRLQEKYPEIT